jgi:hypothetical protein
LLPYAKNLAVAIFSTRHDMRRMNKFDEIEVRRPAIAKSYLSLPAVIPGASPTLSMVRTALGRLMRKGLVAKYETVLLRRNAEPGSQAGIKNLLR